MNAKVRRCFFSLFMLSTLLLVSESGRTADQKPRIVFEEESLQAMVPWFGLEGQSKILLDNACAILRTGMLSNETKDDDYIPVGSGFLVGHSNRVFAVTCYHVVAPLTAANQPIYVGITTKDGFTISHCRIRAVDPTNDLAILQPMAMTGRSSEVVNTTHRVEHFGDSQSLIAGRAVAIPGFPLAIGYQKNATYPVMRIGIIAQYTGGNHFLIDGFASHGQSGSPVWTVKQNHRKLVGMITSHVSDTIGLSDEAGRPAARLPYNSGLGRAVAIERVTALFETLVVE